MAIVYNEDGTRTYTGKVSFTVGGGNDDTDIQAVNQEVEGEDYINTLTGNDYGTTKNETEQYVNKEIPQREQGQDTILSIMKNSNIQKDEELKLKALEITALSSMIKTMFSTNLIISKEIGNLSKKINDLVNTNLAAVEYQDYNLIMQSQLLEQTINLNTNVEALTKATKEQQLQLNADTVSMGNLSIDTQGIVNAITQGVTDQVATNAKIVENLTKQNTYIDIKSEHLEFAKNGTPDLKDSEGNPIKPREISAKNNAENFIDKESINKTTIEEIMEFNQDIRNVLEEYSPESLFSDIVGATDGFNSELNPLKYFIDEYKKVLEEDKNNS